MADWDARDLALLARVSSDLTALAATIAVLRRRRPSDAAVERADVLVDRLHVTVHELIEQLRS